jgi:hypothetical protein
MKNQISLVTMTAVITCSFATIVASIDLPVLHQVVRSDWVDVRSMGAVGDGSHDDTIAIQHTFQLLSNTTTGPHLVVYFPPGRYVLSRTLELGYNKTANSTGGLENVALIGHGALTTLMWMGEANGTMLWSNGCTRCRAEGLVFDGQGVAGVGIDHKSFSRYESRWLHINLSLQHFLKAGVRAGHKPYGTPSAEMLFQNCLFLNNAAGLQFLDFNQYDNTVDGCYFGDNGIGLDCEIGNFYLRNSRFERSTDVDIVVSPHSNSVRRVVSVGSKSFIRIPTSGASSELKVDDCRVSGWLAGPAIYVGARGPIQVIDSEFSNPPLPSAVAVELANSPNLQVSLTLSGARAVGGFNITRAHVPEIASVIEIPADMRTTGATSRITTDTQFFKTEWPLPSRVLDAVNFGAKGDGETDDTSALQALLDASSTTGTDTVAYLPAGQYLISKPLLVKTGSRVDGSGYGSSIVLAPGFPGPPAAGLLFGDASVIYREGAHQGVSEGADGQLQRNGLATMLTNLAVDNHLPGSNTTQPIKIGRGAGGLYVHNLNLDSDGYGCNHGKHFQGCQALGVLLEGMGPGDTFHANTFDGRMVVSDSGEAVVLTGVHIQGGTVVQAPGRWESDQHQQHQQHQQQQQQQQRVARNGAHSTIRPADNPTPVSTGGFVGELVRAESFNLFDISVFDSQSYIVADIYTESTWQYILLAGTAADQQGEPGLVTIGGVKVGTLQYSYGDDPDIVPVIVAHNYHGQLVHMGGHFQFPNTAKNSSEVPPPTMSRSGEARFDSLFLGDSWLWQEPTFDAANDTTSWLCTMQSIVSMVEGNRTIPTVCHGGGNISSSSASTAEVTPVHALVMAGAAYDQLRTLGDWDLELNYPAV